MPITYAGQVCYDAGVCLQQCRQQGLPTDWAYKANRYVHPIGMKAGFGHILLRGAQLKRIVLGKGYDLEFKNANGSSVTLKSIRVIGEPLCVTPGHESTLDNAMFLVELSDRRYDLIGISNTCYNWVYYPTGAYADFSLDGGLEWTLERIVEDLLQQSGLGVLDENNFYEPSDTLSVQLSDGTNRYTQYSQIAPWQIDARASRAIDCAEDLLYQYGFLFWYDIFNDKFGVYDSAYNISITDTPDYRGVNKDKRLLDSYEGEKGLAAGSYIPKYIRTFYPVYAPYNSNVEVTDYACIDAQDANVANNYIVYAQNPCPALVDETGSIVNASQIFTNTSYVVTAIRQMIARRNDSSFHRVYAGFQSYQTFDNTIYYDCIFWQDLGDGRGPCTGVVRVGNQGIVPLRTVQASDLIATATLRSRVPTNDTPSNGDDNSFVWMNGNIKNPLLRAATPDDIYTAPSYARWDMSYNYGAGGMRESILRYVHGASKGLNINRSVLRWADAMTEGVGGEYGNRKWWYQKFRPNYTGVVRVTGPACTPGSGSASGSCSSGSSSGLNGLYAGFTQYYDVNSNTFIDGEPCYVIEAAGNNLEEREYVALRSDSKNGIPVFITNCCADGGGSGSGSGSGSAAECDACLSRLCISYNSSGSGSGSGAAFRLFYLDANGCYREVPTCPDGIYDGYCPQPITLVPCGVLQVPETWVVDFTDETISDSPGPYTAPNGRTYCCSRLQIKWTMELFGEASGYCEWFQQISIVNPNTFLPVTLFRTDPAPDCSTRENIGPETGGNPYLAQFRILNTASNPKDVFLDIYYVSSSSTYFYYNGRATYQGTITDLTQPVTLTLTAATNPSDPSSSAAVQSMACQFPLTITVTPQ